MDVYIVYEWYADSDGLCLREDIEDFLECGE